MVFCNSVPITNVHEGSYNLKCRKVHLFQHSTNNACVFYVTGTLVMDDNIMLSRTCLPLPYCFVILIKTHAMGCMINTAMPLIYSYSNRNILVILIFYSNLIV